MNIEILEEIEADALMMTMAADEHAKAKILKHLFNLSEQLQYRIKDLEKELKEVKLKLIKYESGPKKEEAAE